MRLLSGSKSSKIQKIYSIFNSLTGLCIYDIIHSDELGGVTISSQTFPGGFICQQDRTYRTHLVLGLETVRWGPALVRGFLFSC